MPGFLEVFRLAGREPSTRDDVENELQFHLAEMEDLLMAQGATRVFVLQVGRVDRPLAVPRRPWEVARVSFEIARRHRFTREMAELPRGVEAHVLPAGGSGEDDSLLAYRDFARVRRRIDTAYDETCAYLDEHLADGHAG